MPTYFRNSFTVVVNFTKAIIKDPFVPKTCEIFGTFFDSRGQIARFFVPIVDTAYMLSSQFITVREALHVAV